MSKHYHYQEGAKQKTILRLPSVILVAVTILVLVTLPVARNRFSTSETEPQIAQIISSEAPRVEASEVMPEITTPMPWPNYGYAAYGVPKDKLFASSTDTEEAVPIASLAKLITVLAVLEKKPLREGQQGPTITLDKYDVDLVGEYARKSGTYTVALEGMQISEYQALQAILMVSSNNMADSLARWAFGSVDEYTIYANRMLKDLGIENTTIADDASGYSPNTISTPEDMTKIGQLFMKHPVLREITVQKSTTIPGIGYIANYNNFANNDGIIGIKVGNTDEAGKCFIAANIRTERDGSEEVSVAVVLGAADFYAALEDTKTILNAGNKGHDLIAQSIVGPKTENSKHGVRNDNKNIAM